MHIRAESFGVLEAEPGHWPEPTHPYQEVDTLIVFGRGRDEARTPEGTTIAPHARARVATAIDFAATHPKVQHIIFTGGKTPGNHLGNDTSEQYGKGYRGEPEGISMLSLAQDIIDDFLTNGHFTEQTSRSVRLSARSYSWDTPTDLWQGLAAVDRSRLEQTGAYIGLVAQPAHLQRGLRIARSLSALPIVGIPAKQGSEQTDRNGLLPSIHSEMILRGAMLRRMRPSDSVDAAAIERRSRRAWRLQEIISRQGRPHHFPDERTRIAGTRDTSCAFIHAALRG